LAGNGNTTRALFSGGYISPSNASVNTIDFIEYSSTGNAVDFGDLSAARMYVSGHSSSTRAFVFGGTTYPASTNIIGATNINSLGNEIDWGDLTQSPNVPKGGAGNYTRGVRAGGAVPSTATNVIDYWSLTSRGNAVDFGDLVTAAYESPQGGSSNNHGGLQEFQPRAPELYSPTGKVVPRGLSVGNIGILAGGKLNPAGTVRNDIQFVHISTTGNSSNFGDLTASKYGAGGGASSTRSLFMGGFVDPATSQTATDYFEFSTKGNAASFGSLTAARAFTSGCSNSTRALMMGGSGPAPGYTRSNVVDYFTIASIGNASDFGDLSTATSAAGATASSTRAIVAGGTAPGDTNVIEYFTIGSTGNATDFGDLTVARGYPQGLASSTRGVFGGGYANSPGSYSNVIDYITIGSTGNAIDFGDLTVARSQSYGGMSNNTRGVFLPGTNPDNVTMDYTSNGHGGLS
jgi:hypothetical protein